MITQLKQSDVSKTAFLHKQGMPNDFLPSFGINFLEVLHRHLLQSRHSIGLGAFEKNELQGFIVGTTDISKLLKEIFIKSGWQFFPYIIYKVIASPKTIKYLYQTLFYGKNKNEKIKAELIILSIDEAARRKHLGSKLIKAFHKELKKLKIRKYKVGTLSTNLPANSFYRKTGGMYTYSFTIYDRTWNVYYYTV